MELRDIEIFLTLAEELHFGRTAERLHMTQARVSQAIKKQEHRIGAALFERINRAVALTPVGKQLYADILPMYRGLHEGLERARQTARGTSGVLRLGLIPSNFDDYRPLIDAFTAAHPGTEVQLRHTHFGDPFGSLRSGETDIAVIRRRGQRGTAPRVHLQHRCPGLRPPPVRHRRRLGRQPPGRRPRRRGHPPATPGPV
ncbi:hypothetical protein C1I98_07685, partial [Spongiactinospora gelatinilytica]